MDEQQGKICAHLAKALSESKRYDQTCKAFSVAEDGSFQEVGGEGVVVMLGDGRGFFIPFNAVKEGRGVDIWSVPVPSGAGKYASGFAIRTSCGNVCVLDVEVTERAREPTASDG